MDLFKKSETKRIAVSEIKGSVPGLEPAKDEVLLYLFDKVCSGELPVYFGAVPFELIVPFDKEYDPRKHPVGRAAVDQCSRDWLQGTMKYVCLYERGDRFILSDDYITFFAAVEGSPRLLPAWILGKPLSPRVEQLQGPIQYDEAVKVLFGY